MNDELLAAIRDALNIPIPATDNDGLRAWEHAMALRGHAILTGIDGIGVRGWTEQSAAGFIRHRTAQIPGPERSDDQ